MLTNTIDLPVSILCGYCVRATTTSTRNTGSCSCSNDGIRRTPVLCLTQQEGQLDPRRFGMISYDICLVVAWIRCLAPIFGVRGSGHGIKSCSELEFEFVVEMAEYQNQYAGWMNCNISQFIERIARPTQL